MNHQPADPEAIIARLRAVGCVYAEDEARVLLESAREPDRLEALLARRLGGEPLEHVVGWAEFSGLRLSVGPGVFVPRQRTMLLAREAVRAARAHRDRPPVLLELCCGVAPVLAVAARQLPAAELVGADLAPVAVRHARRNLPGARLFTGDLFAPLPADLEGRVDVVAVNAPYVPSQEIALMPPEARVHEPPAALDGGPDGLRLHRRVAAAAPRWLAPGGVLMIETGRRMAAGTAECMAGAFDSEVRLDDHLEATVVLGRLRPAVRVDA